MYFVMYLCMYGGYMDQIETLKKIREAIMMQRIELEGLIATTPRGLTNLLLHLEQSLEAGHTLASVAIEKLIRTGGE